MDPENEKLQLVGLQEETNAKTKYRVDSLKVGSTNARKRTMQTPHPLPQGKTKNSDSERQLF